MVVGVDGCRGGWFAVALVNQHWRFDVFPNVGALWASYRDTDVILIDIPIGLAEDTQRLADTEAQRLLHERRSTVFAVPVRAAVYASAFAEANSINRSITGRGISKQVWNITPKIREVDALLRTDIHARQKFREGHPEVAFWGLTGHHMRHPKRGNAGYNERMAVLEHFVADAKTLVSDALKQFPRLTVSRDDIVDALVLAVTAQLGHFHAIPERPEIDARGLPMQITYAQGNRILRLHHAQITIPPDSVDAAREFYVGVLGLREIPKPQSLLARGGFWMQLGDVEIHVGVEEGFNRLSTKGHLAYQVDSIAYWRAHLQTHGIEMADSVPIPGYERFECRDPFGNRLEFIQVAR